MMSEYNIILPHSACNKRLLIGRRYMIYWSYIPFNKVTNVRMARQLTL